MPLYGASTADVALAFENPTDHPLDIEVNSDPDSDWMSAAFVPPQSTAVAHVVDHGTTGCSASRAKAKMVASCG